MGALVVNHDRVIQKILIKLVCRVPEFRITLPTIYLQLIALTLSSLAHGRDCNTAAEFLEDVLISDTYWRQVIHEWTIGS